MAIKDEYVEEVLENGVAVRCYGEEDSSQLRGYSYRCAIYLPGGKSFKGKHAFRNLEAAGELDDASVQDIKVSYKLLGPKLVEHIDTMYDIVNGEWRRKGKADDRIDERSLTKVDEPKKVKDSDRADECERTKIDELETKIANADSEQLLKLLTQVCADLKAPMRKGVYGSGESHAAMTATDIERLQQNPQGKLRRLLLEGLQRLQEVTPKWQNMELEQGLHRVREYIEAFDDLSDAKGAQEWRSLEQVLNPGACPAPASTPAPPVSQGSPEAVATVPYDKQVHYLRKVLSKYGEKGLKALMSRVHAGRLSLVVKGECWSEDAMHEAIRKWQRSCQGA